MIIGIPKEIKSNENRVALTPGGAAMLKAAGHTVLIETGAGAGSGFSDEDYAKEGAVLIPEAAEVWAKSEMIMKVKEPLPQEFIYFREDLTLFAYLHLANEQLLTEALVRTKMTAIAYETIQMPNGSLPLLTPMSEVAGGCRFRWGLNSWSNFTEDGASFLAAYRVCLLRT